MNKAFDELNNDRIIEAVKYNPFAIQLLVKQIAGVQESEAVLHDLERRKGDAVVQRVFDLSFDLPQVGNDGRNVLLAFAPFALRATRQSLAAVAGFGNNLNRLDKAAKRLSDLKLIETTENSEKFFVKGLIRECIKRRLEESGRADEFYKRFIKYFLKYAEEHARHSEEDFLALEAEKGNGAYAMHIAFQRGDWKSVIKFFLALREFLDRHWYWSDLIDLSEKALIAVQKVIEEGSTTRNTELNKLLKQVPAIIGIDHQDRELARSAYAEALRYYKPKWQASRKGSKKRKQYAYQLGITLHQMGVLRHYEGNLVRARWWYQWSLRLKKECDSQRGIAAILNNLGVIVEQEGNIKGAADLFRQALSIFNKLKPSSSYAVIAERNLKNVDSM
jgi:tetratricopeptide (TPR) repeat protein